MNGRWKRTVDEGLTIIIQGNGNRIETTIAKEKAKKLIEFINKL